MSALRGVDRERLSEEARRQGRSGPGLIAEAGSSDREAFPLVYTSKGVKRRRIRGMDLGAYEAPVIALGESDGAVAGVVRRLDAGLVWRPGWEGEVLAHLDRVPEPTVTDGLRAKCEAEFDRGHALENWGAALGSTQNGNELQAVMTPTTEGHASSSMN